MAFFRKLKDRLFKSSSKLDEGLEAIVEEGGALEAGEPEEVPTPPEPAPEPEPEPLPPHPEPAPEPGPAEEPAPEPELPEPAEPEPAPEPGPAPTLPEETPPPAPEEMPPDPVELPERPVELPDAPPVEIPVDMPGEVMGGVVVGETAERPGFMGRIFGRKPAEPVMRRALDDDMLESLEELLITADMGVDTAMRVTANLAEGRMGRKVSTAEIKGFLADEIARIMEPVAKPMPLYAKKPQVVLVVGVNGSGKTTTIGKLASQFRAAGKSVVIAAGDTFRAAAVEQLQVWGERAGVPVMTAPDGSDPASLAFDAMARAEAEGADLLMIDTAGRLQNRQDLMEELQKIVRVIGKRDPDAPHNTLLVLDATTGQNALSQVEIFQKIADVSGLVMTKLDGTARGGVLVALADRFGLPIHAIGVGEQIDDLAPFDPGDFAKALTGAEG
ncbi:MAG: signal recognition particle-docking protein FtsY [Paracoccaceae bacterium]|nr:signal recognition particle-docking protein FtsY [Paracoccaceae bacterium]